MTTNGYENPRQVDPNRTPAYRIDHTVELTGKVVASTKRRIKFTFGFANAEAYASGAVGIELRGSEHSVELVWSVTSGKRRLIVDGRDAHFSIGPSPDTKFCHTWEIGSSAVTFIAHAAPASSKLDMSSTGEWRQYDLLLDRKSFFELPKIFKLGIDTGIDGDRGSGGLQPQTQQVQQRQVHFAQPPPSQPQPQQQAPARVETMDLLGFDDIAPPAAVAPPAQTAYHQAPQATTAAPAYANTTAAAPPASPPSPHQQAYPPAQISVPAAPVSPASPSSSPPPAATAGVPPAAPGPVVHPVSPVQAEDVSAGAYYGGYQQQQQHYYQPQQQQQQQDYSQGPPPLPEPPVGFGVGAAQSGGGYGGYQQQQQAYTPAY